MPTATPKPVSVAYGLRGALLTPLAAGGPLLHLRDAAVLFDEQGRIAWIGSPRGARRRRRGPLRDVRPHVIVPGFVDAHLHFPQTRIIGRATGPLLDWLDETVFPEEARFRRAAYATEVADEMIDRMVSAGTTTASIFSSSSPRATEILFERLLARGLRAAAGLTLMDQACPEALAVAPDKALRACRRLAGRFHGADDDRLRFSITPRFAISCSKELLAGAGRLAAELDLPIQTHVAETKREGEATLEAHPYAKSYLDVYAQHGLVGPRTVLAHAIHLSRGEWGMLAKAGGHVAHCPDSNFFLGSGRMRAHTAWKRGVNVALGSDVAAGRSFSMRRAMASAYDNALCAGAAVSPAELFRMATLDGARALGWGDRTGSIEVGKDADLAVLRVDSAGKGLDALLAAVVFDTDDAGVRASYVRGARLAVHGLRHWD